jgi:hypothetical protein
MTKLQLKEIKQKRLTLSWKDSLSIQHLLDAISAIIADEYIQTAKENPETFTKQGGPK